MKNSLIEGQNNVKDSTEMKPPPSSSQVSCLRDFCGSTVVDSFETYAFDYGLRIGDRIVAVDGKDTSFSNADEVKALLRGEIGAIVKVTVLRPASSASSLPFRLQRVDLELPRRLVHISDVKLATYLGDPMDGVGYINLHGFNADSVSKPYSLLLIHFSFDRVFRFESRWISGMLC